MTEHKPLKLKTQDLQTVLAEGRKEEGKVSARMHNQIDSFIGKAVSAKYLQDLNNAMWNQDFFNQFKEEKKLSLRISPQGIKDE